MTFKLKIILYTILTLNVVFSYAQDKTYAEKLGYPKGSKLLILHVDDAGMSDDSNIGVETALEKGIANSCSMMMPCSWTQGFIHYLNFILTLMLDYT